MPFRVASLGRTTIDIDPSFLVLIGLFVFNYQQEWGWERALMWAPVLLISVLVHEFGHALTIGAFGFGASRIVLLGMGGLTINQRSAKPWQEVVISVAGPIAGLIVAGAGLIGMLTRPAFFFEILFEANIFWTILNLLPVPPLDGGHALRHLLRTFMSELAAFNTSTWVGMIAGVAIAIYGVRTGRIWLAVIIGFYAFRNFQAWRVARAYQPPPSDNVPDGMK